MPYKFGTPFCLTSIRKEPGKRPFFEKERGASMPLWIEPLTDSLMLEEKMDPSIPNSPL